MRLFLKTVMCTGLMFSDDLLLLCKKKMEEESNSRNTAADDVYPKHCSVKQPPSKQHTQNKPESSLCSSATEQS